MYFPAGLHSKSWPICSVIEMLHTHTALSPKSLDFSLNNSLLTWASESQQVPVIPTSPVPAGPPLSPPLESMLVEMPDHPQPFTRFQSFISLTVSGCRGIEPLPCFLLESGNYTLVERITS